MTLPTTTARQTPNQAKLRDGYRVLYAFALDPDVCIYEKTGTPPGYDGGDPTDTTTFHNTQVRTKAPRTLIDVTNGKFKGTYHPLAYNQILALINQEGSITCHLPNGDTVDFYGYLKSFAPQEISEGQQPEAEFEIIVTNTDASGNEVVPNYKTAAGTDV